MFECDIRGQLAAKLTCWHRLTEKESDELVALWAALTAERDALQAKLVALEAEKENLMEELQISELGNEVKADKIAALEGQEPVAWVSENAAYYMRRNGGNHYGTTLYRDRFEGVEVALYAAAGASPTFDLVAHLHRQIAFSQRTFGPGMRTAGVIDHIRKELIEIEEKPSDLTEWVDLILLAFDGAWRAGHTAEAIAQGINAKQTKNEARTWPDWRTAAPDKAIEHVRSAPPVPIKDHEIAKAVNTLRDIAIEFHGSQQLRERIAQVVRSFSATSNKAIEHVRSADEPKEQTP